MPARSGERVAGGDRDGPHALEETSLRADWHLDEPSSLEGIREALPPPPEVPPLRLDDDGLRDRLLAAWLGRCAGCNLGKPVEGWSRERIRRYLELADAYPIDDYLPVLDPFPEGMKLNWCWPETTRGNVEFMARDDDTDYTILGMHILEDQGFEFGPMDVAEEWLDHLPFTQVYTAERAAYRNLVHGHRRPGDRHASQPLSRMDRRADPGRHVGLRVPRRPGARVAARVPGLHRSRTRRTGSTARCGSRR